MKVGALCIKKEGAHFDTPPIVNKKVLPFRYDLAEPFNNNIARVGLYGKSMKINKQGSECL